MLYIHMNKLSRKFLHIFLSYAYVILLVQRGHCIAKSQMSLATTALVELFRRNVACDVSYDVAYRKYWGYEPL